MSDDRETAISENCNFTGITHISEKIQMLLAAKEGEI